MRVISRLSMLMFDDDLTMVRLRLWRKISAYFNTIIFVTCVFSLLCIIKPCLIGLGHDCEGDKLYVGRKKITKQSASRAVQEESSDVKDCPILSLNYSSNSFYLIKDDNVVCKQAPPLPGSCEIAEDLFFTEPIQSCVDLHHEEFCYLEKSKSHAWIVTCNVTETKCASTLSVGLPAWETGEVVWTTYKKSQKIGDDLTQLLRNPDGRHYGFAFIMCNQNSEEEVVDDSSHDYHELYHDGPSQSSIEQLLLLPPPITRGEKMREGSIKGLDINMNIILVDSVSRQHFFRSLKKSASALESIASNTNAPAYIFDFELVQALKSRTFETLQAVFSGYVNVTESPFPTHGVPPRPLNLSSIFQRFRNKSYRTLWLEDLCYLWEWGIAKDLHFLNLSRVPSETWKLMWEKLADNGVDDIDLTISMCKILNYNDMKDPFRNTHPVCFNGKHQHEYLLDYLKLYQMEMQSRGQLFLTVTSTNVGHEETGRRVQTLDQALKDYISFLPSMDNTLSVIFSDHGNSYGEFFRHSQEAQAELFHPFMFFIIPRKVASKLGSSVVNALKTNTKRLITALDLHYTLLSLASSHPEDIVVNAEYPVSKKGLFELVDSSRTCDSVPRIPPSQCICTKRDVLLESSSYQALFGYHAVGAINTEIQKQFLSHAWSISSKHRPQRRCQPLELKEVTRLKEIRESDKLWKMNMDIHVQESQIFFISIIVKKASGREGYTLSLETVSRVSKYASYEQCVDPGVELSLCICNTSISSDNLPRLHKLPTHDDFARIKAIPHFQNSVQELTGSKGCLHLFSAQHWHGVAIFVGNTCEKYFLFNLKIDMEKKYIYKFPSSNALLVPGSLTYFALVVKKYDVDYSREYSLQCDFEEVRNLKRYMSFLL